MSALAPTAPLPVRVAYDPLARFRRKIAQNALNWLHFLQTPQPQDPSTEFANLHKAAEQALAEPSAGEAGLALVDAMWPLVSQRGYWLDWAEVLGRAQGVARRLGHPLAEASVLDQRGEVAQKLGETTQALAWQSQALAIFRQLGEDEATGRVLNHLSQAHMTLGQHTPAQACCQEAATIFTATGNQADLAQAHLRWGLVCTELNRWEEALDHHRTAQRIAEGRADLRGQAMALNNQGHTQWLMKAYPAAIAAFEEAITLHTAAGDEINAARSRVNLGNVYDPLGEPAQGLALNRQTEPLFRRLGDRPWLARVLNNQGIFLEQLGQIDDAAHAYAQAIDLHLQNGNRAYAAMTLLSVTEMWIIQARLDLARSAWGEAEGLLAGLSHPPAREMERLERFRGVVGG